MSDAVTFSLDQIRTASPCSANWATMTGDERKRHCRQCDLHVYNLSAMTRAEAESLVLKSEGRLCARYYRRADGTIITKDCPVGVADVRRKRARALTAAAALLSLGVGAVASLVGADRRAGRVKLSGVEPFSTVRGWFVTPPPTPPPPTVMLMGDICVQPPAIMGKVGPAALSTGTEPNQDETDGG